MIQMLEQDDLRLTKLAPDKGQYRQLSTGYVILTLVRTHLVSIQQFSVGYTTYELMTARQYFIMKFVHSLERQPYVLSDPFKHTCGTCFNLQEYVNLECGCSGM